MNRKQRSLVSCAVFLFRYVAIDLCSQLILIISIIFVFQTFLMRNGSQVVCLNRRFLKTENFLTVTITAVKNIMQFHAPNQNKGEKNPQTPKQKTLHSSLSGKVFHTTLNSCKCK